VLVVAAAIALTIVVVYVLGVIASRGPGAGSGPSGWVDVGPSGSGPAHTTAPAAPPPAQAAPPASPPAHLTVPDVTGRDAASARDELRRLGFTNVRLTSVDQRHRLILVPANWTVREQNTPAGQVVAGDAVIVLGCVKS